MKKVWFAVLVSIMFLGFLGSLDSVYADVTESLSDSEHLLILQERIAAKKAIESPAMVQKGAEYATEFAGACKAFLTTFDSGTEITIERLNQFMGTSAGKFTVVMIGWKVFGRDAVTIFSGAGQTVLGILLLIPYAIFLRLVFQNFITGKKILVSIEGKWPSRKKTYKYQDPIANQLEGDSYGFWAAFSTVASIIFTVAIGFLIY